MVIFLCFWPILAHFRKFTASYWLSIWKIFFINTFIFQFLISDIWKKNCLRISLFWNITIYRQKYRHVGKMTSFWHHDVIELFFYCYICISVFDLLLFKKNACQYLYFKMLLYISQKPTCRENDVIMATWCWYFYL